MLKFQGTNVVVSKGYGENPALRFFDNESSSNVRFRIGDRVYDKRAEKEHRYVNINCKAFNGVCERIKKMGIKEGSYLNIWGRFDEESWEDDGGTKKSAPVLIIEDLEYAYVPKKDGDTASAAPQAGDTRASTPQNGAPTQPQQTAMSENFEGYQDFGGANPFFPQN